MGKYQAITKYQPAKRLRALAVCLLAALICVLGALAASPAAHSEPAANTEGYTFTDVAAGSTGAIEYKVTVPASTDGSGEVELTDGKQYAAVSESSVLTVDTVSNGGFSYKVTAVKYEAFKGNSKLFHLVLAGDLTAISEGKGNELYSQRRAIGSDAFAECGNLASVEFTGGRLNGIGEDAFYHCTSLASVTFSEGFEIFGDDHQFGIGPYAFCGTALTEIKIPAITCARRVGDYYNSYASTDDDRDVSGYAGCWHDKLSYFAVETRGICEGAFQSTKLEKIVFAAGNDTGMFAYWNAGGAGLRYVSTLKSVVYEAAQPYYGNYNAGMNNGSVKEVWGKSEDADENAAAADPSFYYAVDFYATQELAEVDDAAGTGRIGRVEYVRDTPTSAIQAADNKALAQYEYGAPGDYAQNGYADGTTPNPNEAAKAAEGQGIAGFENASEYEWVWMLGGTQSRRSGLSDSCQAYLAKASDLSAGRMGTSSEGADQIATMQILCDQNLSCGSTQNSPFDYRRYYAGDSVYMFNEESLEKYISTGSVHIAQGKTPWFTVNSKGAKGLLQQLHLYDARGNELGLTDESKFKVAYSAYSKVTGELSDVDFSDVQDGPLLVTVTPLEGSGYNGESCLQEWILLKHQTGTVKTLYTTAAHETWYSAVYSNGTGSANPNSFDTSHGFAVAVSSGDLTAALAAVPYAGLAKGAISTVSSDSSYGYGIALTGTYYSSGSIYGKVNRFEHEDGESLADYVASNYEAFNENRGRWGLDDPGYSWGGTALLVNPKYLSDVAAGAASYAYANAAPIFYTEEDGSVSSKTAECLMDFSSIMVMGDSSMVPDSATASLQASVERLSGMPVEGSSQAEVGSACSLSLAVAQRLTSGDVASSTLSNVAIVVASSMDTVVDAVGVMNYTGHTCGVTLTVASTADAKRVAQYLRDNRDDVGNIRIFGRGGNASNGNGFNMLNALDSTWDEKAAQAPSIGQGDTLELYGAVFSIGADNALTAASGGRRWGTSKISAGSYNYGTTGDGSPAVYTLGQDYTAQVTVAAVPVAVEGLVYNGTSQVGVAAGTGYNVENGSAKKANAYTATVSLQENFCWADGSRTDKKITWSMAKASLEGATVALASSRMTATGKKLTPAVTKVVLANGYVVAAKNYKVSYSNNLHSGKATVTVVGRSNCSGQASAVFKIIGVAGSGSGSRNLAGGAGSGNGGGSAGTGASGVADAGGEAFAANGGATTALQQNASSNRVAVAGWSYFAPTGSAENSDTSLLGSVQSPPALNIAILLICCAAFAAALFYATRARKETDDQLPEEPHA